MAQNYIQSGDVMPHIVPASTTITSGDVVIIGLLVAVALGSGVADDTIQVKTKGVFSLNKLTTSGNTFEQGDRVYYDTTAKKCTSDTTKTPIGYAYAEAAQADTTMEVMLANEAVGVTPTASPTLTATGAVADNTKASIDTELGKVKDDLEAIIAALQGAGVFI